MNEDRCHKIKFCNGKKEVGQFKFNNDTLLFSCPQHCKLIQVSADALITTENTFNTIREGILGLNPEYVKSLVFTGDDLIGDVPVHVSFSFSKCGCGSFRIYSQYDVRSEDFNNVIDKIPVCEIKTSDDLKELGFNISNTDTNMILRYLEGHDYFIGYLNGSLYISDINDPDNIGWKNTSMDRVLVVIKDWILSKIDDLKYEEDQEKRIRWKNQAEKDLEKIEKIHDMVSMNE